jgi:hypothetical protein
VVVGMDGLDRVHMNRLIARGGLPHLARMADEGVIADLTPTMPMLSPIIWTTVASGYPASQHGIGGWTTARGQAFTSADVRTRRLWDITDAQGARALVAGWLMTWPASPMTGTLVSDKLVWSFPLDKDPTDPSVQISAAQADDRWALAWPPDEADAIQRLIPTEAELAEGPLHAQVAEYGAPFHPVRRDETQVRVFEDRWDTSTRLGFVYLVGADQVSHLYWPFVDPRALRVLRTDPSARKAAADADRRKPGKRAWPLAAAPLEGTELADGAAQVDLVYAWLDASLGRIMARIDPETTTLLVLSDHGFQASHARPALHGAHRDPAVLLAWGGATRAGATIDAASILDIAPTVAALAALPGAADHPGRVLSEAFELPPAVAPLDTWTLPRIAVDPTGSSDDPATRRMMEQLEALGYVDDLGAPIPGASRDAKGAH